VEQRTGRNAPEQMTEGAIADYVAFESGWDPGDPVDQAILATQRAVFPLHGMMPGYG
jgi:acetoin utilization protein AcuC